SAWRSEERSSRRRSTTSRASATRRSWRSRTTTWPSCRAWSSSRRSRSSCSTCWSTSSTPGSTPGSDSPEPLSLLEVKDLHTSFRTDDGIVRAVEGVSFEVEKGQTLGIVGESGSGKSVTCLTIMGLNPSRNTISTGEALWKGKNLLTAKPRELREIRGSEISMIFQDPMTSLNPVHTIGRQLIEAIQLHRDLTKRAAHARARELLKAVGIPKADARMDDYPHQ